MAVVVPVISTFDARGIDRAIRDFKKLEKASDKTAFGLLNADKAARTLAVNFTKIAAGASAAIAVIGKPLVTAASNMQESISKVNAVFGSGAAEVERWADSTAKNLGISKRAALEAAGTYGNLFQAFGLTEQQAKGMSVRLVELAADMASFNNTSVDDAIRALSSGLSGEMEPMKKYGSVLSEVRLKQEALRLKLIQSTTGTLPPAIKAQAAYSLILKDTAIQQGDVARTSDGVAFQMKSLGAQFEDVQAKLGTALLPAFTNIVKYLNNNVIPTFENFATLLGAGEVGMAFNYLSGSIINGLINLGALGKAVLALTTGFVALRVATVTYTAAQGLLKIASEVTTNKLRAQAIQANATRLSLLAAGGVVTLFTTAASLYAVYASNKAKAVQQTKDFTEALLLEGAAQTDAFVNLLKNNNQLKIMVGALGDTGLSMDDVTKYIKTGTGEFKKFVDALDAVPKTAGKGMEQLEAFANAAGISANQFSSAGGNIAFGLSELANLAKGARTESQAAQTAMTLLGKIGLTAGKTMGDTANTTDKAAKAFEKFRNQAESVVDQQKSLTDALKNTKEAQTDLEKATSNVLAAQEKLNRIAAGYGAGSAEAADAQNELTKAQRDQQRASYAVEEATFAVRDAERELNRIRQEGKPEEIRQAEIDLEQAKLDLKDAEDALTASTKSVREAQERLNEVVNGATEQSKTYKDALGELRSAQDEEVDALDRLTDAKNREFEMTKKLAAAELVLQTLRKKLTKKQKKEAERLLESLTEMPAPMQLPSKQQQQFTIPAGFLDLGGIDFGGFATPMAEGGIVTKPTLALIGEGGESEAVIPLSKMGGSNIVININAGVGDPNEIGRQVVSALQAYQRRQGAIPIKVA